MTNHDPDRTLEEQGDDLAKRLHKAHQSELGSARKAPKLQNESSGLGQAFRISTEMISALLVGVGMGWTLDRAFDTKPVMMVICIFLGGAAGLLNVYKTAMRMAENIDKDSKESDAKNATNENKPTFDEGKTPQK